MGTIAITTPSDGTTADAADIATPLNTIVSEFNGNIDNANIKTGAAIAADKIAGGVAGMFGAFSSWTPTLTNMTLGNGTLACTYIQVGKTVFFKFKFTLGSTSAMGTDPQFSLPVTAIAADTETIIGRAVYRDAGTERYVGDVYLNATTTAKFYLNGADATWTRTTNATSIDSTRPMTWTTSDIISGQGFYEAA